MSIGGPHEVLPPHDEANLYRGTVPAPAGTQ